MKLAKGGGSCQESSKRGVSSKIWAGGCGVRVRAMAEGEGESGECRRVGKLVPDASRPEAEANF